jgi:hypothetical protein
MPIIGILGLIFITIALMINLYSYQIVSELKANLRSYYEQLNDPSIFGQIGGKFIDFFTGGAQTQKKKDIEQMEKDLVNGLRVMEVGLGFAGLATIFGFTAVMINVKKPTAGRSQFIASYIFAIIEPVIVIWASVMLLMFTGILLLGVTSSLLGIMFLIIETQRLQTHKRPKART